MPEDDDLDRAVDARIEAYRPDTVPPFAALTARKRARDRRRNSRAAALSALSVVGVAGVMFAGPSLTGGGDRLTGPVLAGPAATPSVSADGRATTRYGLGYADSGAYDFGRDEPLMKACLALSGTSEVSVQESLPPGYYVKVTGTEQAKAFERCVAGLDNVAVRNLDATSSGSLRTGAQVCRTQPAGPCQKLDADTANRIYDALALDSRPPVDSNGVRCQILSVTYNLLFDNPGADVQEITVPAASCLPVTVGGAAYAVDDAPRELVRQSYDAGAGAGAGVAVETPNSVEGVGLDAFIDRCVGAESPAPAPEYVGLTEDQATRAKLPESAGTVSEVRVVGRDGTCLGRSRDFQGDRINVLVAAGEVVWAGRF